MNLPTMEKDRADYHQSVMDDEISQSPVKMSSTDFISDNQHSGLIKKYGGRVISNILILLGGWLTFSGISMFLYLIIVHPPADKSKPLLSSVIGVVLLFLGIGKAEQKSNLLLYGVFPLIGLVTSLFIIFSPFGVWYEGEPFAALLFFFLIALIIFYYYKDLKHHEKQSS